MPSRWMELFAVSFLVLALSSPVFAEETAAPAPAGVQQFEGFNLQGYTETGEKAWDVKGDTADIAGDIIKLTNIDANKYGEQDVNLKAKNGTMDKASGNLHLERDVVITSETGSNLKTDSLDWQKEKDLVTTNDKVTIVDERMTATGTGLVAHPELKIAQLNSDVTVEVKTEEKTAGTDTVTITCDGTLEIDQAKYIAVFNENVVAVQTGRELKADRVEVYFDAQTNQIKEMVCIGHVEITQGENKTFAEKAVYSAADKKLTLSGRPKLILITEGKNSIASFGDKDENKSDDPGQPAADQGAPGQ
ncbi:MAG: LPS export ABC transporter periplasmic protein LptC [Candidatus Omnitrophota bacterium]|nr:LPS export ABC transporter periplasmic protein LptC [Candidatus Omnitrophota bacterium]MDZ4242558.1 LPS export ABC transporter periplasmic protein LptC [Candidatus Omnitrophota bacterium]